LLAAGLAHKLAVVGVLQQVEFELIRACEDLVTVRAGVLLVRMTAAHVASDFRELGRRFVTFWTLVNPVDGVSHCVFLHSVDLTKSFVAERTGVKLLSAVCLHVTRKSGIVHETSLAYVALQRLLVFRTVAQEMARKTVLGSETFRAFGA
jgi:hypothetical protein